MARVLTPESTDNLAARSVPSRAAERYKRLTLNLAAALIFFAGFVSAATGAWFLVGNHPFHRAGGFSEEYGMTRAELDAFNPQIADWALHVSDQVGSVSMGWGLFIMLLALAGIRKGERPAWYILWIAAIPTLAISAFGEIMMFGHIDEGSILSMGVLLLYLAGMLLPFRLMLGTKRAVAD